MLLRTWRIVTVRLAALSAGMSFSHLLEMPQKLNYDAAMYLDVTHTLYRCFAVIGGPVGWTASYRPFRCRDGHGALGYSACDLVHSVAPADAGFGS